MTEIRLPRALRPLPGAKLVRLGKDHDGGYLVSAPDINAAECLVGLGLNDDWSSRPIFCGTMTARWLPMMGRSGGWCFCAG